jgi:hypothetical protein
MDRPLKIYSYVNVFIFALIYLIMIGGFIYQYLTEPMPFSDGYVSHPQLTLVIIDMPIILFIFSWHGEQLKPIPLILNNIVFSFINLILLWLFI